MEPQDGLIVKSAEVKALDVTEDDLTKINKFALSPLTAEEVFTFKVIMADNETDDRNFEPFNLRALKDLQRLYIGKTVIKDHKRSADNQVARIYETELKEARRSTGANEPYTQLIAKCYMVKTDSNADLIAEIKAGIKKEVSTSCQPKKAVCNICGTDNTKTWCVHMPGREYDTPNGKRVCMFTLDGAKEAFELSFVAVPAQPRAGAVKHYGAKPPEDKSTDPTPATPEPEPQEPEQKETQERDLDADLRILKAESFLLEETQREEN